MAGTKLHVIGFTRIFGMSQKSDPPSPYDISRLLVLGVQEPMNKEFFTKECGGFECGEVETTPEVLEKIHGMKFPLEIEFLTTNRMSFGKMVMTVTGLAR